MSAESFAHPQTQKLLQLSVGALVLQQPRQRRTAAQAARTEPESVIEGAPTVHSLGHLPRGLLGPTPLFLIVLVGPLEDQRFGEWLPTRRPIQLRKTLLERSGVRSVDLDHHTAVIASKIVGGDFEPIFVTVNAQLFSQPIDIAPAIGGRFPTPCRGAPKQPLLPLSLGKAIVERHGAIESDRIDAAELFRRTDSLAANLSLIELGAWLAAEFFLRPRWLLVLVGLCDIWLAPRGFLLSERSDALRRDESRLRRSFDGGAVNEQFTHLVSLRTISPHPV